MHVLSNQMSITSKSLTSTNFKKGMCNYMIYINHEMHSRMVKNLNVLDCLSIPTQNPEISMKMRKFIISSFTLRMKRTLVNVVSGEIIPPQS